MEMPGDPAIALLEHTQSNTKHHLKDYTHPWSPWRDSQQLTSGNTPSASLRPFLCYDLVTCRLPHRADIRSSPALGFPAGACRSEWGRGWESSAPPPNCGLIHPRSAKLFGLPRLPSPRLKQGAWTTRPLWPLLVLTVWDALLLGGGALNMQALSPWASSADGAAQR